MISSAEEILGDDGANIYKTHDGGKVWEIVYSNIDGGKVFEILEINSVLYARLIFAFNYGGL